MALDLDLSFSQARYRRRARRARIRSRRAQSRDLRRHRGEPARRRARGPFGGVRLRHFGPRPLIEDNSVESKSTSIVNGEIGYKFSERIRLTLEGFNLFDAEVSDIDYFFESRLPERAGAGRGHSLPRRDSALGARGAARIVLATWRCIRRLVIAAVAACWRQTRRRRICSSSRSSDTSRRRPAAMTSSSTPTPCRGVPSPRRRRRPIISRCTCRWRSRAGGPSASRPRSSSSRRRSARPAAHASQADIFAPSTASASFDSSPSASR